MTAVDTLLVGYHFTTHRNGVVCNFRLGGDYPLGIPLITPLSQSLSELSKLLTCSSVEPQLEPPWQHMDTELGMMGWCCALPGVSPQGHLKVISRSLQGQTKKVMFFCFFIYSNPFGVQVSITNDWCCHIMGHVPFHHASQRGLYGISALGVITPLVFLLSHPFPNAVVNQQNY